MFRNVLLIVCATAAMTFGAAAGAQATPLHDTAATQTATVHGVDVSWPQCGKTLPSSPAFAIIGVNNGVANTTNPCLQEQLAWADTATGATKANRVSLYVNTSNPGFMGSGKKVAWPSSNVYEGINVEVPDLFGDTQCSGTENYTNEACAYMYGWRLAYDDANKRGISNPASYTWWLDVETINTWNVIDKTANVAVLEGMNDYFTKQLGAKTGLYTSFGDWFQIVGSLPEGSSLAGLNVWYPIGHNDRAAAVDAYKRYPSPTGGQIVMVQYIQDGFDRNYFGDQRDSKTLTASQAQPTLLNTLFGFLVTRLAN